MQPPCTLCAARSTRRLFEKGGRSFLRCRTCGLVWVWPMPSPEELEAHYAASYRSGGYAEFSGAEDVRQAIAEYRLETIRPLRRPARWLDVGCSGGDFIEAGRKAGYAIEGLDRSPEAIERVRARGLVGHCAQVERFTPERPYERITAFDVLEHSLDPRAFVRSCRGWLEPDGHLVLTLPDVNSIYPQLLMRRHWFYYAPDDHLFYFNRRTLRRLLHEEGFAVERITRAYKPLSLAYAARTLRLFNATLGRIAGLLVGAIPGGLARHLWKLYIGEMLIEARRA